MTVKTADTWFSRYIRLRDAKESNGTLWVKCFTCGKIGHPKSMDNSHFMPRIHRSTRWDEVNCEPACIRCNWTLEGNKDVYAERIDEKHGQGTAEMLRKKCRQPIKTNPKLIAEYYKDKVNALLTERGWSKLKWW